MLVGTNFCLHSGSGASGSRQASRARHRRLQRSYQGAQLAPCLYFHFCARVFSLNFLHLNQDLKLCVNTYAQGLCGKIQDIKSKAEESEVMVKEICQVSQLYIVRPYILI